MHKTTVFATEIPTTKDRKLVRKIGRALLFYGIKALELGDYKEDEIILASEGKPYIKNNPFYFNISHSKEVVLCGISKAPVGLDVEKKTSGRIKIAKRFFHEKEWEYLENIKEESADLEFIKLWTMKESYVKMTGDGLALGLSSFNVLDNSFPVNIRSGEVFCDYIYSICESEPFDYEIKYADYSEIIND